VAPRTLSPAGVTVVNAAAAELGRNCSYLNSAGLAPQLRSVRLAGQRALERHAAPWSIRAADWFDEVERLRGLFAQV
jgi:hypothetical protein